MATKYQDSTPQRLIWKVGAENKPHQYTTWGYDSVLVAFKVDKGIAQGLISFEGYLGFKIPDTNEEWGDWYSLQGENTRSSEKYTRYDLRSGSAAFWVKTVGFSQFRTGLLEPLEGQGEVQVALACHAAA